MKYAVLFCLVLLTLSFGALLKADDPAVDELEGDGCPGWRWDQCENGTFCNVS